LDILNILTPFSLYLQKSAGVMMDKNPYVEKVRRDLLRLSIHLYTYFTSVVCYGDHEEIEGIPQPTLLEQYDHFNGEGGIFWKGIKVEDGLLDYEEHNRNHKQNFPALSSIFKEIIDKYKLIIIFQPMK
jgi:hypothetical protein